MQTNTVSTLDPYKVPWFADCAPSLLTNRTIRRHLNAYSQHTWPEVIKLTLIYGVLGLEQQFPGGTLSIPELRKLVEKGGAQLVVERNLPGLQRQILDLQTNLDAVFDRLAVEPPPPASGDLATAARQLTSTGMPPNQQLLPVQGLPAQQVSRSQHQQQQHLQQVPVRAMVTSGHPASALNPGPVAPKPPDNWRRGESTSFPSPPRTRDTPLRRSADNQGATNPIYPDWWLAAGPPEPPAPKLVPRKVPRKQPRLAYSSQQQPEGSGAASDDLVTAEYLMVPGSGYGQAEQQPVVSGPGPTIMLTSITADNMHTGPHPAAAQQQGAAAAAAAGGGKGGTAAGRGRGPRRPQAAQSKIKQAVAASRQNATVQQQRRQQLLASALAAGSSLFGAPGDGAPRQQQQSRRSSAAQEAVAACAPAAAAEHFLSNPWTSCFLQPSGVRTDVVGYTQLPTADIGADDEGRLGALGGEELVLVDELQPPHAPAAYAVLKRVVAAGDNFSDGVGDGISLSSQVQMVGGLTAATAAAAADIREIEAQQEQVQEVQSADVGRRTGGKGSAGRTWAAHASSSRGVFADITSALNSQPCGSAAAAAAGMQHDLDGADDWRTLPLVDEQAELQADLFYQQQRQQQQQQRQPEAWACDFGHLEGVEAPPSQVAARQRHVSGKPHKKWSETWVGDFGHLQDFPRFARETAFQHGAAADASASDPAGSPKPSSKMFMSPADLQALVAAADSLGHSQRTGTHPQGSPQAAASSRPAAAATNAAAAAAAAGEGGSVGDDAGTWAGSRRAAAGLEVSSSAHSLAARFAELLSRWDSQAADSASQLPAGVAARASVSHATAREAPPPAADSGAAVDAGEVSAVAANVEGVVNMTAGSSSGSYNTAGSDVEAPAGDNHQHGTALGGASADAAALLLDLQQAVSELSTVVASDADSAVGDLAGALSAAAGVEGVAAAGVVKASADMLPAEGHLEGMQEASQMLQQALSRHDALMQLIASLGAPPGSGSDAHLSSAASGSELTM